MEERPGAGVFNQNETAIAGKQNTARLFCAGEVGSGVRGEDGFGVGEGGWCVTTGEGAFDQAGQGFGDEVAVASVTSPRAASAWPLTVRA